MNVIAVLSGTLVGFTIGLVGGGGSVLATPLLLYAIVGLPPHVAIGTGAFAVSVNAFLNLLSQVRSGRIIWKFAVLFAVFGSLGAYIGSSIGKSIDGDALIFVFGLALLGVGTAMLRPIEPKLDAEGRVAASGTTSAIVAFAAGCLAGFFGIGGGVLIVPGLVLATRMPMLNAISTSLLAVTSFGATTAVNYAASGFVNWAIAAQFIGGGFLGGYLGIESGIYLSRYKGALNKAFAALVFAVASYVLYRSGSAIIGPSLAPQHALVEQSAGPSSKEVRATTEPENEPASPPTRAGGQHAVPAEATASSHVAPNGPSTSIEARLVAFLAGKEATAARVTWFDLDRIRFETGETALRPEAEAQLRAIAEILSAHPSAKAIIAGHTDNIGDTRGNRAISQQRAEHVMRELTRLGVDASRLEARGYGAEVPVATNSTAAGRAANRRISVGVIRE